MGMITTRPPTAVATPLPPLNPVKHEKLWPISAPTRPMICIEPTACGSRWRSGAEIGQRAATAPLRASRTKTVFPALAPSTRRTLVAPGFLLPTSKMFTPCERATKYPKGKAPKRYPATSDRMRGTITEGCSEYDELREGDRAMGLEFPARVGTGLAVEIDDHEGGLAGFLAA